MKVILLILDGWGYSPYKEGNAIAGASLPSMRYIERYYSFGLLKASGISVGLPWGEPGNSEVGHLTLGSGRTILQYMPRIIHEIQQNSFFTNPALVKAMENAKSKESFLHFVGLVGSGSVHSYIDHLYALLELASRHGLSLRARLHLFTDGKDSPPQEAASLMTNLEERLAYTKQGEIATIVGRDYGMDRNFLWDRTEKAFNLLTKGEGEKTGKLVAKIREYYAKGFSDNALPPTVVCDENGTPKGFIREGDSVVFFDFREDSERQLAKAFALPASVAFPANPPRDILFVMFSRYEKSIPGFVAFDPPEIHNTLADVLASFGKSQLHIAETEKYAHTTYFFNGLREEPHAREEWLPIASGQGADGKENKEDVAEMTRSLIEALQQKQFDFVVANFAKADTLAHLGDFDATIEACQRIDAGISTIVRLIEGQEEYACVITADHGHVERMKDPRTAEVVTNHTANDVLVYCIHPTFKREHSALEILNEQKKGLGLLADVAPTVLDLMNIPVPAEMTGRSFLPLLRGEGEE